MKAEIDNLFKKFLAPSKQFLPSRKAGTLFEVWISLRIADELNSRGLRTVLYEEGITPLQVLANSNKRVQSITFKSSPGKIGSGNYCFIVFDWFSVQHEIQISIEYEGRSGSLHEIDVSIIPSVIADDIRKNSPTHSGYPVGSPKVAIECKDKKSTGSKDEARNFLARFYDIHLLNGHPYEGSNQGIKNRIYSARTDPGVGFGNRYFTYNDSFDGSFNTMCHSGTIVPEAARYLSYFHINTRQKLTPGSAEITSFINEVADYICNNNPN